MKAIVQPTIQCKICGWAMEDHWISRDVLTFQPPDYLIHPKNSCSLAGKWFKPPVIEYELEEIPHVNRPWELSQEPK